MENHEEAQCRWKSIKQTEIRGFCGGCTSRRILRLSGPIQPYRPERFAYANVCRHPIAATVSSLWILQYVDPALLNLLYRPCIIFSFCQVTVPFSPEGRSSNPSNALFVPTSRSECTIGGPSNFSPLEATWWEFHETFHLHDKRFLRRGRRMRFVAMRCAFAKLNNEEENLLFLIILITTYYINTTKRTILNVNVFQDRTEYSDCENKSSFVIS